MHEEQRERLRVLAASVNETARMARATNSLFLFVALYLALTLLSATDENLLRNGQVVLPQVGVGISIVQSYVLAPLVFLYLHGQALVLLTVLARKVQTFEAVLRDEFPDTKFDAQAKRKECRDWLSAFALVQVLQGDSGPSAMSRVLAWLAIEAIPLALLLAIDLSFVRYQSNEITLMHHVVFFTDLLLVVWFNERVFGGKTGTMWGRLAISMRKVLALGMMGLLFSAHPPNGTEDRYFVWRHDFDLMGVGNLLDAGPCRWWGIACRYLDVSHLGSRTHATNAERDPVAGQSSDDDRERSRGGSATGIYLFERNLRFARFRHARLEGANLGHAQLQGADFRNAQLRNADLVEAGLQRVWFAQARMQGANLHKAQLQGANFYAARLQEANLRSAKLQRAKLQLARLQGAILRGAQLHGAELQRAWLQGAELVFAELSGANLTSARLQGAALEGASLRGVTLAGAALEAVSFDNARLGGADLRNASLLCSDGAPADWRLAWMPGLTYELSRLGDSEPDSVLDDAVERLLDDLIPHDAGAIRMPYEDDKTLRDHLRHRLKNCPKRPFSGAVPKEVDLVVHGGKPWDAFKNWPALNMIDDAYWKAWGEWTVDFACESEYNARSSMRRWDDKSRFKKGMPDTAAEFVRNALIGERSSEVDCPGISAIPDDDRGWLSFVNL